jgi:hypothetical protein
MEITRFLLVALTIHTDVLSTMPFYACCTTILYNHPHQHYQHHHHHPHHHHYHHHHNHYHHHYIIIIIIITIKIMIMIMIIIIIIVIIIIVTSTMLNMGSHVILYIDRLRTVKSDTTLQHNWFTSKVMIC